MSIASNSLVGQTFLDMGATAAGETPNTSELLDGFTRLNQMILSLNIEGGALWTEQVDTHTLTSGLASYTMGPTTSTLSAIRPTRIKAARCYATGYGRGLKIITDPMAWAAITERDAALTLPIKLYVDYGYPNATLHFWPAPTGTPALVINTIEAFSTLAPDSPTALQANFSQTLLRRTQIFALANATGAYTMGPGATFATSRPAQIVSAHVGGVFGHDVEIIGATEWAALLEAEGAGIVLPLMLYAQFQYPEATVNFWPVPGTGVTAEIHSPFQIPPFADQTTPLALPPGFERMLHLLLAVDMYPEYRRGTGIPQELAADAADAKAAVIAGNVSAGQMSLEAAAPPK
jgi:hypothetical protein